MDRMASSRAAIAAALLLGLASPATRAGGNELFAKNAPITRMTEADFTIAGNVIRPALDEGRDGQRYDWRNPATSAAGSITPAAAFERQGMRCRNATFTITTRGETSQSEWTLCKTPAGWKVAEGR